MPKDFTTTPVPPRAELHNTPMGFFQSLTEARKNLLNIVPHAATTMPIISGKTGVRWHMVMDPTALRTVLNEKLDIYPKSDVTKRILRPAIGESLFIVEGAEWRWQRRTASPVFQVRNIDNLAPIMSQAASDCVDRLAALDVPVADIYAETVRMTLEVISDVTFSDGDAIDRHMVGEAIAQYIDKVAKVSFLDMIGAPSWIPRMSRMMGPSSLGRLQGVANSAIRNRENSPKEGVPDLLDLLMQGKDTETGRKMTHGELRDNVLAFITAGHETTALSLAWAMYLCAFDQDVQNRARAEAQAALNGEIATADHIADLGYTRQIIQEALRLYPPAAFISRNALETHELCGREVRKGDIVMIPIYALHRNALLWDNPDHFDPDRFAPDAKYDRYAYIPFGNGPRICIGMEFALRESQIILATLLSRFKFELTDRPPPQPELLLTLRPKGGIHLKITKL